MKYYVFAQSKEDPSQVSYFITTDDENKPVLFDTREIAEQEKDKAVAYAESLGMNLEHISIGIASNSVN